MLKARTLEAHLGITGQVELPVARTTPNKESRILFLEPLKKAVINLVTCLLDAGSDGDRNILAASPELQHRIDSILQYAAMRAAPARMRRANHICIPVEKENGRAISRNDAQNQPGPVCDERIRSRACIFGPWLGHGQHIWRMYLVRRYQDAARANGLCRDPAIRTHIFNPVLCAKAALQAANHSGRDATLSPEKAVRHSFKQAASRKFSQDCG